MVQELNNDTHTKDEESTNSQPPTLQQLMDAHPELTPPFGVGTSTIIESSPQEGISLHQRTIALISDMLTRKPGHSVELELVVNLAIVKAVRQLDGELFS